jgi:hypothetical protein
MGKGLQGVCLHVVDIPEDYVMSAHIGIWHKIHLFYVHGCEGRNAYYMELHVLCPSVLGCKEHAFHMHIPSRENMSWPTRDMCCYWAFPNIVLNH